MKSGAPPDRAGVLHRLLPSEYHGFTEKLISKGYYSLVPGLISNFLETLLVPSFKDNGQGHSANAFKAPYLSRYWPLVLTCIPT